VNVDISGLSLAQWNALVLPAGGTASEHEPFAAIVAGDHLGSAHYFWF
jgi:hypothetical protein